MCAFQTTKPIQHQQQLTKEKNINEIKQHKYKQSFNTSILTSVFVMRSLKWSNTQIVQTTEGGKISKSTSIFIYLFCSFFLNTASGHELSP